MSKDPAILFYTGDFLNGCLDLNFEERGQYITLLCLQHQKGHLSEKTICLSLGSVSPDVLKKFKTDEDGNFYNERMDLEINKRSQYIESRRDNGSKGGRPIKPYGKAHEKPYGEPTENHTENENRNENIYEDIIGNYHSSCPKMSKVISLNKTRKGNINARMKEYGIEKIYEVFRIAGNSDFLNGRNDKQWKADFEWLLRPENFLKVLEGKYANKPRILA